MKRTGGGKVVALLLMAGWMVASLLVGATDASAAFSPSDLEGTWYLLEKADHPLSNGPYWSVATVGVNATGAITGGTFMNSMGDSGVIPAGGSFTIDATGVVSGSATGITFPAGKLDPSKTILGLAVTEGGGDVGLMIGIKGGGTFTTADLAGTWYFIEKGDETSSPDTWWSFVTVMVNAAGVITGGSGIDNGGTPFTITGGSLSVDGLGRVSGSASSDTGSVTFPVGKLDASKTILGLAVGDVGGPEPGIIMGIKGGGTFTTADLAGTWYLIEHADNPTVNGPFWSAATVNVNATGTITGGTFMNNMGESGMIVSGTLTVDALGQVSGSGIGTPDGINMGTLTFSHGKMDATKNILMLTVTESGGDVGLMVGIKGSGAPAAVKGDFNGDGKSDILWQDATSGDVYVWFMNGTTLSSGAYVAQGMGTWKVVGTADFTSDGKPDLLWQNQSSGDVYLWTMNGITQTAGTYLAQGMGTWKVVATADFTGDGKPDIVWQDATSGDVYLWTMNGTTQTGGTYLAQGMGTWKVVAAGDFTGDGKSDILWQDQSSGDVYLWTMNGTTQTGGTYLAQGMGTWKVVAAADFTGDGKRDIVWQDTATGDVYLWTMNGTTQTAGTYLAQGMGTWKVRGPK